MRLSILVSTGIIVTNTVDGLCSDRVVVFLGRFAQNIYCHMSHYFLNHFMSHHFSSHLELSAFRQLSFTSVEIEICPLRAASLYSDYPTM